MNSNAAGMTPKQILHYCSVVGLVWTLCTCLFYSNLVPRVLLYGGLSLFIISWLIEFVVDQRWKTKPTKEWFFFGLLIVFYLWAFLYRPWDGQVYFHHHMEQRLPLLAFGIVGLFGLNERHSRATLINAMVVMSVGSIVFLFLKTGWQEVLSPDRVFLLSETRIHYLNAHMGYNFFLNSTLIGMWYLLFHAERKPVLWQKIAYPISALIIFAALLCSDGRSGFFMGLAIIGLMTIIEIYRYKKWIAIGCSVVVVAGMLVLSALHPRISAQSISYDLRYSYWKSAFELIEQKPLFGYGMSNAQEAFDQVNMKYVSEWERQYWTVEHTHYVDCHNQFIQTTLEYGIVGLILLLAIYLSPLFICWGKREWWLAFFFTLISLGQSLFDMFLTGRFNMIYCILLLMTLRIKDDYQSSPSHAA